MDEEYPDIVRDLASRKDLDDDLRKRTAAAAERFKTRFVQALASSPASQPAK